MAFSGGTGDGVDTVVMADGRGFPPIDFCVKEPLVLEVEVVDDAVRWPDLPLTKAFGCTFTLPLVFTLGVEYLSVRSCQ